MLWYISWPEFGLSEQEHEQNCNTTEKSTINSATECCVLSLCSMNIAKNLSLLSVVWQNFITLVPKLEIHSSKFFLWLVYVPQLRDTPAQIPPPTSTVKHVIVKVSIYDNCSLNGAAIDLFYCRTTVS